MPPQNPPLSPPPPQSPIVLPLPPHRTHMPVLLARYTRTRTCTPPRHRRSCAASPLRTPSVSMNPPATHMSTTHTITKNTPATLLHHTTCTPPVPESAVAHCQPTHTPIRRWVWGSSAHRSEGLRIRLPLWAWGPLGPWVLSARWASGLHMAVLARRSIRARRRIAALFFCRLLGRARARMQLSSSLWRRLANTAAKLIPRTASATLPHGILPTLRSETSDICYALSYFPFPIFKSFLGCCVVVMCFLLFDAASVLIP